MSKHSIWLILTFSLLLLILLSSLTSSALLIVPSHPKIVAQTLVSFNITSLTPITIKNIYFTELHNNNDTYYGGTNATTKVDNLTSLVSYQMIGANTDLLKVTVFYKDGPDIVSYSQLFYVFPPSHDIEYVSIAFVIVCVGLGLFFTYKFIKRKLW